MDESVIYEYASRMGKVLTRENGVTINVLENTLNELARKGYDFVNLNQYIYEGMNFILIMRRKVN